MSLTPRLLFAIAVAIIMAILLGFAIPVPAYAACKHIGHWCQPGEENCENHCITTSDGGPGRDNIYSDDRRRAARERMYRRYSAERAAAQRRDKAPWGSDYDTSSRGVAQRQQEGRDRWRDDGQVVQGLPGKISPFVPGSTQDLAWKDERRRRGIQ